MYKKRTHRARNMAIVEALECRRLLSGPNVGINYIDESGAMQPARANVTYDAYAGVPFHVNGIDADANSTAFPEDSDPSAAIKAEWQWNFGDPSGQYNELDGFNAAHIYANAGTYPLTLTVTDEFRTPSTEEIYVKVGVAEFDPSSPEYKGSFYVAATSSGDGKGGDTNDAMNLATLQHRLNSPDQNYPAIPSDSQILFNSSDEFDLDSSFTQLNITQSNITISKYSDPQHPSSTDPLFVDNRSIGSLGQIFSVGVSTVNVVVDHLDFMNNYPAASKSGNDTPSMNPIHTGGKNLTVENCNFTNLGKGSYAIDGEGATDGLMILDNNVYNMNGNGYIDYFFWDSLAADALIVGNTVDVNTNGTEGIIRVENYPGSTGDPQGAYTLPPGHQPGEVNDGIPVVQRLLISQNDFTNTDGASLRIHGCWYVYIADNTLNAAVNLHPTRVAVGDPPSDQNPSSNVQHLIFERNTVDGNVQLGGGIQYYMIRSNVVSTSEGIALFSLGGPTTFVDFAGDAVTDAPAKDIFICNNTGLTTASNGSMLSIGGRSNGTGVVRLTFDDNLYSVSDPSSYQVFTAPGALLQIYMLSATKTAADLSCFSSISDNIWPHVDASNWANRKDEGGNPVDTAGGDQAAMYIGPYGGGATGQSQYFISRDEWQSGYVSSATFQNITLSPGGAGELPQYAPESNAGSASAVPGVFTDFYGHPRPTSGPWTAGAVEMMPAMAGDIDPGTGGSSPRYFANVNGTTYFAANDGTHGTELWKTDGTTGGTERVADINPGPTGSNPICLTNFNGLLYFIADDGSGAALWESNGTSAGTKQVIDSAVVSPSGPMLAIGDKLYFATFDQPTLWVTDGTPAGTQLLKDGFSEYPGLGNFTSFNGRLFFTGYTIANGTELWSSDGTPAGTSMVKDIIPGSEPSEPQYLTVMDGKLYFSANDAYWGGDDELWQSDGTPGGTIQAADIKPGVGVVGTQDGSSYPKYLTTIGDTLYFSANDGMSGQELWKYTDGIASPVKDINPGNASSNPKNLVNVGGILFFSADDGQNGVELWRSNGTRDGTYMVKDIDPGPTGSSPRTLIDGNGTLYFVANNGSNGYELWKSDGSPTGTVMVADIDPDAGSSQPTFLTSTDGMLYFAANDGAGGTELWELYTPAPS